MLYQKFVNEDEGLKRLYVNEWWYAGIKNFKEGISIDNINFLELHKESDELFIPIEGKNMLVTAEEKDGRFEFEAIMLKKGSIYNVPSGVWHTNVLWTDSKIVLSAKSDTSLANSLVKTLEGSELENLGTEMRAAVK